MYSVIRFKATSHTSSDSFLTYLRNARKDNSIRPSARDSETVSLSISAASIWDDHLAAIRKFLEDNDAVIQKAHECDTRITVDVAIDPADRGGVVFDSYLLDLETLLCFSRNRIDFMFSVYQI